MTAPAPPPSSPGSGDARSGRAAVSSSRAGRPSADGARPVSGGRRVGRSLWLMAAPLFMLVLALLFLASSTELTGREALYPQVLAVLVAVLAVVSMRGDHREGTAQLEQAAPSSRRGDVAVDDDLDDPDDVEGRRGIGLAAGRVLAFLLVAVVAVTLMSYLGFFLPSVLLVGGGLLVLGVRTPWKVVAYTAGVVLVAYGLFVELLQVPFPPAPWS